MNRRTCLIAFLSAVLGIVIGGLAVYAYAATHPAAVTPLTPRSVPATVFGEQFSLKDLLARAKPDDAKFSVGPGGERGLTRYGYDGCQAAVWNGQTNPEAVKETIFKEIESRFQAKQWQTERGNALTAGDPETSLASYELRYHSPDYSAGGWVRLFVHQEGSRVGVVLVFNTGRDWPSE